MTVQLNIRRRMHNTRRCHLIMKWKIFRILFFDTVAPKISFGSVRLTSRYSKQGRPFLIVFAQDINACDIFFHITSKKLLTSLKGLYINPFI